MNVQAIDIVTSAVECISAGDQPIAYIIRASFAADATTFVTPPEENLQVGFVVYPAQGEIPRHRHHPIERHVAGTGEVLVVRHGCCEVDLYDDDEVLIASRSLATGDVIILVSGGHGFRMLDDTVLLEIKQGPYPGVEEKEHF